MSCLVVYECCRRGTNRESQICSRNKKPLLSQLYFQQSFNLRANVRKQLFAELPEPMPSSVTPRVDLAASTTEATSLSREGK